MRECSGVTSMFQAGEVISDPEVAYRQYREWLKTPEAQAERDEHHARTYAESRDRSEARQEVQRRKWTPP